MAERSEGQAFARSAAEATEAGTSAALAAAPETASVGGKRRRYEDTAGAEGVARKKARSICPHGRGRRECKECGGAGLCPHQRRRSRCKECGGAGICQHQRRRSNCKECGGASICQHQRIRRRCKECREEADESMPDGLEEL